jgi:hypothetical protein
MREDVMTPRMTIVWEILERAKDAGDEFVIAACRRLIIADRIGWKRHANKSDWTLIRAFAEDGSEI